MPSVAQVQQVARRRSRSISDIQRAAICRYQRRNPSASPAAVVLWAEEQLGVTMSIRAVSHLKKRTRVYGKVNPLKVLFNILEEYTHEPILHMNIQPMQVEKTILFTDPVNENIIDNSNYMDNQKDISPGAVKNIYMDGSLIYKNLITQTKRD